MTTDTVRALPLLRVVAAGTAAPLPGKLGQQRYKATILLSPLQIPPEDSRGLEISEWPGKAAAWILELLSSEGGSARLFVSPIATGDSVDTLAARPVESISLAIANVKDWPAINELWKQSLTVNGDSAWPPLLDSLQGSLSCVVPSSPAPTLPNADATSSKGKMDYDGALLVKLPLFGTTPRLGSVLPIQMADLAMNEERCRAIRVGAKIRRGEKACEIKPLVSPSADAQPPQQPIRTATDLAEELRKEHLRRYNETVDATNQLRIQAESDFKKISDALTKLPGECGTIEFFRGLISPIPTGDEAEAKLESGGAGSHAFGTWLQRRDGMAQTVDPKGEHLPTPADSSSLERALKATPADELSRQSVMTRFHALVDDPVLSRLFCLAVDVTFSLTAELKKLDPAYLHLWIGPPVNDADHPRRLESIGAQRAPGSRAIVTAAKRHDQAFWPVSVFEAGIRSETPRDDSCLAPLIEQQDGHWRLGRPLTGNETAPAESLRYDVVTIDARRAMDAKGSVGSAGAQGANAIKSTADDFGQRQSTAGFVLVDRGRASQVLRELALAQRGAECKGALVLYAEDLTIGRRVDVAAVRPGVSATKVEWRSLMQRLTRYVFRPRGMSSERVGNLWRAVDALIPGSKRTSDGQLIDEGSFVVASRHVPTLPSATQGAGGETPWDVAADEAIFTWDGTPSAVLTEGGSEHRLGGLPYQRIHDLPRSTIADASKRRVKELRHAALRFGVPYAFRMRSVFAGHGSPETHDPTQPLHADKSGWMLPVARGATDTDPGNAAPRRFLRHDSILAPTLLLPRHLATTSLKAMGFEQLDQAIVRTVPADGHRRKDPPDDHRPPDHSPYVSLDERLKPTSTVRVFVAPECSYEEAVRHGVFDVADAQRVRQGGLRRVARDRSEGFDSAGSLRRNGFPCVVTREFASVDSGGAQYYREYLPHSAGGGQQSARDSGIPVFEPLGSAIKSDGRIGWLPDPAVSHFSVRARVRGSDRYLDGELRADLYDRDHRYPDAMPLAVELAALPKSRPGTGLALSIHDLVGTETATVVGFDARTGIMPKGVGAAVTLLRLRLHEGEDFDIEVCCLPTEETLANLFALPETIAIQRATAAQSAALKERLEKLCGQSSLDAYVSPLRQSLTGIGGHLLPDGGRVLLCAKEILDTIRSKWPVEEVAAVTRFRACHAVPWPTYRPQVEGLLLGRPAAAPGSTATGPTGPPNREFVFPAKPPPDVRGSTTLLLAGTVELDLEQADGFEVLARGIALSGRPIDAPTRSRSLISRRSGRWPTSISKEGARRFVTPQSVLGFKVDVSGRVTFEDEQLTLMRVDHLPSTLAIGQVVKALSGPQSCVSRSNDETLFVDLENPIFEVKGQRTTRVRLLSLHSAALASWPIRLARWRPPETEIADSELSEASLLRVGLPQQIGDTRARKLTFTVRALSRFAETFETAPMYVDGKERLLRRRQALSLEQQSTPSDEVVKWMCSTVRPPACEPLRPEPSFMVTRQADDCCGPVVHSVMRRAMVRLYFRRGWFASGEGERVGIVLWPPRYFDSGVHDHLDNRVRLDDGRMIRIGDFDDKDLGRAGAYVTRWGGDPIRRDTRPQDAVLIPPASFVDAPDMRPDPPECPPSVHDPRVVPQALMPIPRDPNKDGVAPSTDAGAGDKPADGYLPVTLLTYEPCFDLDREQWYVDVDLRSHRPSEPFVRFGLVRYQEHSISPELAVSEPVTVMAPMLPYRRVDVHADRLDSGQLEIHVTMKGPGSAGIRNLNVRETFGSGGPLAADAGQVEGGVEALLREFEQLQRPWMRVWLSRESVSIDGATHREPLSSTDALQALEVQGTIINDELVWHRKETVPADWTTAAQGASLVAYIEEVDRRMPASYAREPIAPTKLFDKATFVDSGPRFSARIPFLELSPHRRGS